MQNDDDGSINKQITQYVPIGNLLPPQSPKSNLQVNLKTLSGNSVSSLIYFEIQNRGGSARCVRRSVRSGTSIEIESDLIICFRLDDDFAWEWADKPFTLKRKRDAKYYQVKKSETDTREFELHVTKNNGTPNGDSHACCFNIVMAQPFGAPIEISFDPDVKNPPPPPGRSEAEMVPEGKSVPI